VVGAVAVIVTGVLVGVEVMLLVLAGCALLGVIALLWASVQSLTGQSPLTLDEALTLAAPSAEEEQKRAVLRALKDIEYELSVGKISPQDHAEFSARYRAEAMRLMQRLDESEKPAAAQIEALVEQRLAERARTAAATAVAAESEAAAVQTDATETETDAIDAEAAETDAVDAEPTETDSPNSAAVKTAKESDA
jgi:hypothetical protein